MMLLYDEEYKHVERRYFTRQWVSRREERGAYYTIFLLHSILKGKNPWIAQVVYLVPRLRSPF